jgi:hypothetical protein
MSTNTLPEINKIYSCIENGREVFTGTCTKITPLKDGDHMVRLEGKTPASYHVQRASFAQFVDPKDAPRNRMLTEKERGEQIIKKF